VINELESHPEGRKIKWTERQFKIYMPSWTNALDVLRLGDLVSVHLNLN